MSLQIETRSLEIISAFNVQTLATIFCTDVELIADHFRDCIHDFDLHDDLTDAGLLLLYGVSERLSLEIHHGGRLCRAYRYLFVPTAREAAAPAVLPLGTVPIESHIRLTATPHRDQDPEYCDDWFRRLGWCEAEELEIPPLHRLLYGTSVAGGLTMEHELEWDPRVCRIAFSPRRNR